MDKGLEEMKAALNKAGQFASIFVIIAFLVICGLSSFYTVNEQEQAVITQFGKAVGLEGAGLKFKIPFIQNVTKVRTITNGMELGYINQNRSNDANAINTQNGLGLNPTNSSASTMENVPSDSFMITKDLNFVSVDFYIEYKVSDPVKYLYNSEDAVGILRNILQSEARTVVSEFNVDDVLTTAKSQIQVTIKENVAQKLESQDIGIVVTNITIQDAEPPTEDVIAAFKDVETAKQEKVTAVNTATKEYNEQIPNVRALADGLIKDAEGQKQARVNEAEGQVARFNSLFSEYIINKDINRTRMYLEVMEQVLPGVSVFVTGDAGEMLKVLNVNEAQATSSNTAAASQTQNTGGGTDGTR